MSHYFANEDDFSQPGEKLWGPVLNGGRHASVILRDNSNGMASRYRTVIPVGNQGDVAADSFVPFRFPIAKMRATYTR